VQFVAATFEWPYLYNKLQMGDLAVRAVVRLSGAALADLARRIRPGKGRLEHDSAGVANLSEL
jgi:hypothetical protein